MACHNPLPLQDTARRKLWLCVYCEKLFISLETPGCSICSAPISEGVETCASCYGKNFSFIHNRSGFAYEGLVRDLIRDIKFRQRKYVAQGLGRLWATFLKDSIPKDTILVPLPMHEKKRRRRGFDQAQIIAHAISEATGIKTANVLERTQNTPPQSGLHPQQRIENVKGAFRIKEKDASLVARQNIVLIDDIYTTGASLNECAKVLKISEAAHVYAMTLAIAIKESDTQDDDDAN